MIETVIILNRTSIACPSQWDAVTDKGNRLYIRYRGGHFSITLIDDPELNHRYPIDSGHDGESWVLLHEDENDDILDGWMSDQELFDNRPPWLDFSDEVRANATDESAYYAPFPTE